MNEYPFKKQVRKTLKVLKPEGVNVTKAWFILCTFFLILHNHRSTCVSWSTRCTTQMSASVTLSPSTTAAVRSSTWRISSAPRWPTMSCWRPLWAWWGCGQTREAERADSGSSSQPSMNVSESLSVPFFWVWTSFLYRSALSIHMWVLKSQNDSFSTVSVAFWLLLYLVVLFSLKIADSKSCWWQTDWRTIAPLSFPLCTWNTCNLGEHLRSRTTLCGSIGHTQPTMSVKLNIFFSDGLQLFCLSSLWFTCPDGT